MGTWQEPGLVAHELINITVSLVWILKHILVKQMKKLNLVSWRLPNETLMIKVIRFITKRKKKIKNTN